MLHTVNKSPYQSDALTTCFGLAQPGSAVLLIEDGIYGAMTNTKFSAAVVIAQQCCAIYVLEPDLQARGFNTDSIMNAIQTIDYDGFVSLVEDNPVVQAW
ncbi:MAG TPA: sulfurtransferase complex subunit TusB [Gammaproteobacteria bacterium]|jgi:tRNA 2-thiouridine synthesizing protein B|nr:sulfurtransferase complex subunit TusB [Gammaproteobacteria bacterium]HAN61086.1 sulfurtransferase complex subunit TusB [Gammaproteobacteria bacterium]|tara:strand:+ start:3856 stop:4155 length:300 start_codon:yes stop_codon:yes gene_type:complete